MMKTRKLFFILFISSLFLFSLFPIMNVSAGVDQSCTVHEHRELINNMYQVAQSFQPTEGILTMISLKLVKDGSAFGDLTVRLRKSSCTGDIVKTWTVSSSSVPTGSTGVEGDYGWVELACYELLDLGATYYIVMTASSTNDPNRYGIAGTDLIDDHYPRGTQWRNYLWWPFPPLWTDWYIENKDCCFKTYMPNQNPYASFTSEVIAPLTVSFNGTLSSDPDGSIVNYEWDWTNDGSYDATGSEPTHQYPDYGSYSVKLRVTDNEGGTDTCTGWVIFTNTPPTAVITTPIYYDNLTVTVYADESSDPDGSIVEYAWDWTNDGVYDSYGITKVHTYSSNGTYSIKLRVTDDEGAEDTDIVTITVTEGESGQGGEHENGGGSSGFSEWGNWFELLLSLPMYVIILIIAIVFVMAGTLAFFIKPEVIGPPGNLGIVPSVSTLFIGILAIIMIILWYAEFEMIYILLCGVLIAVVFALDIKYFFGRKK